MGYSIEVLLAFVSVILLLSLVSTFLVQSTSSVMRLRGRNLYRGLREIFRLATKPRSSEPAPDREEATMSASRSPNPAELVEQVLQAMPSAQLGRSLVPQRLALSTRIRGARQTWIDLPDLQKALAALELDPCFRRKVEEAFPHFEILLRKRFAFIMRLVSIFWAVVVAVAFQVSAPELLRTLSIDPETRVAVESVFAREAALRRIPHEALAELRSEAPPAGVETVAASEDASVESVLEALRTALPSATPDERKQRDEALARYDSIATERRNALLDETRGDLAKLDIELWPDPQFYGSLADPDWRHIFGVLLTAGLLALGAPFWFRALQNVAALRDVLKPTSTAETAADRPATP